MFIRVHELIFFKKLKLNQESYNKLECICLNGLVSCIKATQATIICLNGLVTRILGAENLES